MRQNELQSLTPRGDSHRTQSSVLLPRIPVPPPGRLPAAPLYWEAGGARVPIFIFLCHTRIYLVFFVFVLFFYLAWLVEGSGELHYLF